MERNKSHTLSLIEIVIIEKVSFVKSKIKSIKQQPYIPTEKFKKEIVYESFNEFE